MKRCKKCVMTTTRPGISFADDGICFPCKNFESKHKTNWDQRWQELEALCDKHRGSNGDYYDCIITVSGGKDSTYQVYLFKEKLGMNPLCVMVDNGSWTETGTSNFYNISEHFGVDILRLTLNRKIAKILTIRGFEEELKPNIYWDRALYVWPLQIALKYGIKLVVWGENTNFETGGPMTEETPDALVQLKNGIISPEPLDTWCRDGITMKDLQTCVFPTLDEMAKLEVIFTSYYVKWSRYENVRISKECGFKGLDDTGEWDREGLPGFDYEQVDTIGYLVNQYCKFIKFGFSSMTELCSDAVRHGKMTREEAIKKINEHDWRLDPIMLDDFCKGIDMDKERFWEIMDKFANRDLVEKRDGMWRLIEPAI